VLLLPCCLLLVVVLLCLVCFRCFALGRKQKTKLDQLQDNVDESSVALQQGVTTLEESLKEERETVSAQTAQLQGVCVCVCMFAHHHLSFVRLEIVLGSSSTHVVHTHFHSLALALPLLPLLNMFATDVRTQLQGAVSALQAEKERNAMEVGLGLSFVSM
jgi:hypothetical protein